MNASGHTSIREWTILVMLIVVAIATYGVFDRAGDIKEAQQDGIIRGYKTRATACRAIEALAGTFPPSDPCLEPVMVPYFTPGQ